MYGVSGFKDSCIDAIATKYLTPPQAPSPRPLPNGNQIIDGALYKIFIAISESNAWNIVHAVLDPEFLHTLIQDLNVTPKHKQVALLLLLVIASDSICSKTSDEAKGLLVELGVVLFHREHHPYAYKADDILREINIEASLSSQSHTCPKCVAVPNLGVVEATSCSKYLCAGCQNFTNGRDTVHTAEGTYACPTMQQIAAWANMVHLLVPLARIVANSSEYRHVSEEFTRLLDVWRRAYCFWALPMLFAEKKGITYLKDALSLFEEQTSCVDVLWRHVSLLLHMQKVLQIKVCKPLKKDSLEENRKALAEFQEEYGRFLPPLP